MSELNRDAAALMRAGRTAFRPDESDRERVLRLLNAVLGESVLVDGAHQAGGTHAAAASRLTLKNWLVGGLAVVALGTSAIVTPYLWTRTASHPEQSHATPAASAVQTIASARTSDATESNDIVVTPERARGGVLSATPRSGSRGARPAPDPLPEEVRLLSRAEQQMHDGLAGDALKTLAEHERRFPTGSLAEERLAARVQALCMLGRTADAKGDLMRLTRAYPRSPQLERARKVCGFDVGPAP
jgi:hypothetical protein